MKREEIDGIIVEINYPQHRLVLEKEITTDGEKKKIYKECFWDNRMKLEIKLGDALYGSFQANEDGTYHIIERPFVETAASPYHIVKMIQKQMYVDENKAKAHFATLSNEAGGDKKVVAHLTNLSRDWNKCRDVTKLGTSLSNQKKFTVLLDFWYRNVNLRKILCLGVSHDLIKESLHTCEELYPKLVKNPYTVACIPMELCESIIRQVGIDFKRNGLNVLEEQEKGLVVRMVYNAMKNSAWTCTPISYIERMHDGWRKHEEDLIKSYNLVIDDDYESLYLKVPLRIEEFVAEKIKSMVTSDKIDYNTPVVPLNNYRYGDLRCQVSTSREMATDQIAAIQGGVDHTFSIITGGAGTGKTTCLSEIVNNLEERGIGYALASFTGKAVSRVKEVCKRANAYTMHRLIEMAKSKTGGWIDHLIIDEASMVTTQLFYEVFTVYEDIKKITLIGDVNQLQPIGWGSLFSEVVLSKRVPLYRLTTNYRVYIDGQNEKDGIILNSNNIVKYDPETNEPFRFIPTSNFNIIEGGVDKVMEIVNIFAKEGISPDSIVTLCPYTNKSKKDGENDATVGQLNKIANHYQKVYEKGEPYIEVNGKKWREGDVVILNKNDSAIGVYNGEMGRISALREKDMLVDFGASGTHEFLYKGKQRPERNFEKDSYSERTVANLDHGYVLTVNKAQGSEWDFVILFVPYVCLGDFVTNRLIYTAITRAKRAVYLVAQDIEEVEKCAVKNPRLRQENLGKRLMNSMKRIDEYKNKEVCTNAFVESKREK